MKRKLVLIVLTGYLVVLTQTLDAQSVVPKPGVKEVQVSFATLKPVVTFKVGKTADWVLVTDDAVWVASTKPYSVQRIEPKTNKVISKVNLSGEACSGMAVGFGSIWVPLCGKLPSLVRIDTVENRITATLSIGPAGPEGGIAAGGDSVWMITDEKGTLTRIDPNTNKVRQKIFIPPGSYDPILSHGIIWITGFDRSVLTAVDAVTGEILTSIPVGPKPRFLTAGAGSIWTLNQGDGTISRVDEKSRTLTATIATGIPGSGGDISYGAYSVWASVFDIPLSRIDSQTNKVLRQWVGRGGDSLRFGHDSIWLTDYRKGLLWRFRYQEIQEISERAVR